MFEVKDLRDNSVRMVYGIQGGGKAIYFLIWRESAGWSWSKSSNFEPVKRKGNENEN